LVVSSIAPCVKLIKEEKATITPSATVEGASNIVENAMTKIKTRMDLRFNLDSVKKQVNNNPSSFQSKYYLSQTKQFISEMLKVWAPNAVKQAIKTEV